MTPRRQAQRRAAAPAPKLRRYDQRHDGGAWDVGGDATHCLLSPELYTPNDHLETVMKATILDLRRRMSEILQALDRNERVTITYRGQERAVLVPMGGDTTRAEPTGADRHPAFGMWADREDLDDVAAHVRDLRRGRQRAL